MGNNTPATARDYLAYGSLLAAVALWTFIAEADGLGWVARAVGVLIIVAVWVAVRALVRRLRGRTRR